MRTYPDIKITDPVRQCRKVSEELIELTEALAQDKVYESLEEYWDCMHALQQIGYYLQERHGVLFNVVGSHVEFKNRARGLYK